MQTGEKTAFDFDLGIITALWKPEFKAVLALRVKWEKRLITNDATNYFVGASEVGKSQLKVVAASCSQMGMASGSVLAMKMIGHFRPRFLAICGIAA